MIDHPPAGEASLPMYDLPELRAATDAWWAGLAAAMRAAGLREVPNKLTRGTEAHLWRSPRLLFSQSCGYPLTHTMRATLKVLATPGYAAPGCTGVRYSSALVVSEESSHTTLAELRGTVCVVNSRDSHSGYNSLRAAVAPLAHRGRFFARVRVSGAHTESIGQVARREADVCAVDCVTHALLVRYRPAALAGTRVLGYTASAPGLPYVTRADMDEETVAKLGEGLRAAHTDPGLAAVREALLLSGIERLADCAYAEIDAIERQAVGAGYPELG